MKEITLLKKYLFACSITIIIFGLVGCGGGDDNGNTNVQISGAVVDSYVAYARIYVDVNNNGKFNSEYEPYAYTDKDGYFSVSKDGNTNYCALNPKQYNYRYCFKITQVQENGAIIRVQGGRDLLTTQTYDASMSLLTNGELNNLVINPLTSAHEVINNNKLIKLAKSSSVLSLTDSEIVDIQNGYQSYLNNYLLTGTTTSFNLNTYDPLDFSKNSVTEKDRGFKLAIQLHKIAEAMAKELIPTTIPTGKNKLTQKDLMSAVYFSLIHKLVSNNTSNTDDLFKDTLVLNSAFNDAHSLLAGIFPDYSFDGTSNDIQTLSQYLNCVLSDNDDPSIDTTSNDTSFGGGTCSNIRNYDNVASRNAKLYAAELGTDAITKVISSGTLTNALNLAKDVALNSTNFVTSSNDFSTSSDKIRNNQSANAETVEFNTDFITSNYFNFEKYNHFLKIKFKDNNKVAICLGENGKPSLTEVTWQQDTTKNHIIYIDYLGFSMTIKNLEPTNCGVTGSCLTVEFPDLSNHGKIMKATIASDYTMGSQDSPNIRPENEFTCN
jgi:hypothetical protein